MCDKKLKTNDIGGGLSFAMGMQRRWQDEIERAIEDVKQQKKRSDLGKWVMWYKSLENGRKRRTKDVQSVLRVHKPR